MALNLGPIKIIKENGIQKNVFRSMFNVLNSVT